MNARMSHTQIARYIRSGPGVAGPEANPSQVVKFAAERPDVYSSAVRHLYYRMAEAAFKGGSRANFDRYQKFVDPWLRRVNHPVSHFMSAGIEAFCAAWRAGLGDLTLDSKPSEAKAVSERIDPAAYGSGSLEELLMLVMMGQAESMWSRDAAGETFEKVRRHERHEMIANSGWDRGALSYFNERQVESANRDGGSSISPIPALAGSDQAIVIAMDPNFFRIYGPMVLMNAQQVREIDFVLLLCASPEESEEVTEDALVFLEGLSRLNRQPGPGHIHLHDTPVPDWVVDRTTFYACARFLALPQLLSQYRSVYAIDADLLMRNDPAPFMKSISGLPMSAPRNLGSISVAPWRRYMAGNFVASSALSESPALTDLLAYISAGLGQKQAWTLDQNALSFAIERSGSGVFSPLDDFARPTMVSNFFRRWENNYRRLAQ